ncbi:MAG: MoxR family ATPase, partial [Gammaproteobacteria bacterium]
EGTYPLPEAQLDRFLMLLRVGYPNANAETGILRLVREQARSAVQTALAPELQLAQREVFAARGVVLGVHFAPALEKYVVELVLATRDAAPYDKALARRIAWGASPRGSIALERCARARAWLAGRDYVTPEDVHAVAGNVLGHRVLPSYEATAEGWNGPRLVDEVLKYVPLP